MKISGYALGLPASGSRPTYTRQQAYHKCKLIEKQHFVIFGKIEGLKVGIR